MDASMETAALDAASDAPLLAAECDEQSELIGATTLQQTAVPKATSSYRAADTRGANESQLLHLTGLRTVAALWIVCYHYTHVYMHAQAWSAVTPFIVRGAAVPVNCFVMLSGFITHHVAGKRASPTTSSGALAQFYARRFGRVLVTTYLAMGLGFICWRTLAEPPLAPSAGHVLRCLFFVEAWHDPMNWCPNPPTWTIAVLVPCWLLYPVIIHPVLARPTLQDPNKLLAAAVLLWLMSFLLQLVIFCLQSGQISSRQRAWIEYSPPLHIVDFALGSCAAALVVHRPPIAQGARADWILTVLVLVCGWLPIGGWETLLMHGISPLVAAFLYYSTAFETSWTAKVLASPVFVALGAYTFEIYLFQNPLHYIFIGLDGTWGLKLPFESGEVFLAFMGALLLLAGLYAELVDARLHRWLRELTEQWCEQSPGTREGLATSGKCP